MLMDGIHFAEYFIVLAPSQCYKFSSCAYHFNRMPLYCSLGHSSNQISYNSMRKSDHKKNQKNFYYLFSLSRS